MQTLLNHFHSRFMPLALMKLPGGPVHFPTHPLWALKS